MIQEAHGCLPPLFPADVEFAPNIQCCDYWPNLLQPPSINSAAARNGTCIIQKKPYVSKQKRVTDVKPTPPPVLKKVPASAAGVTLPPRVGVNLIQEAAPPFNLIFFSSS